MASSPARILAHDQLGRLGALSEPQVCRQHRLGDDDMQSQCRTGNPLLRGHDDREGHNLSLEELRPKAFESTVWDARLPKHFERQATSSSTTTKLTLGWRTTASCAGWVGLMMTFSSSTSSPFTWSALPGPGWIICQEMSSIARRISERPYWQLPEHVRASWQPLGPEGLLTKVGQIPLRLHLALLKKVT
jgi:hypothetical protein